MKSGNWRASESVKEAEGKLQFQKILGYHQCNKAGFVSESVSEVPSKRSYACKNLVSSLVEKSDQCILDAKAVQLSIQGQLTKWSNYVRMDYS